ncbi:MAG: hypothetical protein GKC10_01790 [Methanosarcinales archaeon]|nr:hypothetical protein [Methanosarcinales archaeon]
MVLLIVSTVCIASSTVLGCGTGPSRAVHDIGDHFTAKPTYNISAMSFIKPLFNSTYEHRLLRDVSNRTPSVPFRNINPFNEYQGVYLIEPTRQEPIDLRTTIPGPLSF